MLCNGLRKQLIRIISRIHSDFLLRNGLFVYVLEAACNSKGARALIEVQIIVSNVPRVLLRASRRSRGAGGGGSGVNMPNFSEAPTSIALMWICGAPRVIKGKRVPYTFRNVYTQTPDRPRMCQLLVLYNIIIYICIYIYMYIYR